MRLDCVGRKTNQLHAALGELWLQLGESTELGGADRSIIFGVRKENDPVVPNELMEVNGASGGLGLEVGRDRAKSKSDTES